ncbi:ABC transporter ATP-binding protein [Thiocystis violascens]|uniref:ABC-type polysaccharide/polyol phosphate transport system, ATPase component n=1 Tax=Thiocystis violascens (strain ATCC 17096 / DSM 198 / 6111) TaxID=765911 RepID=I3Y5D3_THIV6|nr:ABC transporter ATP-binding protein [Thiocystis violascens]AFL72201.1 ABC-type polysaccharide/polyol phosphate transport system, ATPase component [Thiocystis violascens DSM 198]
MPETLITVDNVSKKFCRSLKKSLWYGMQDLGNELRGRRHGGDGELRPDEFWAVKDVSFELKRGECLGLIGRNGAGKTTLLRMLNGLIKPDRGRIEMRGRVGALIALGAGFNPVLTGRENLYVNASILGFSKQEIDARFDDIVEFAGIEEFIDTPVQNYSSGMAVRLGFSVAAHLNPDILIVDEVLAVGDVGFRMRCFEHMLQLKKKGVVIVFVTHSMIELPRICERAIVVTGGQIVFEGLVEVAIGIYEKDVLEASCEKPHSESPAWIESASLIDESGRPKCSFHTGENIVIDIRLRSRIFVENARLIVHINSATTGILGSFSSYHKGLPIKVDNSGTQIILTIRSIPLLIGGYSFNFSLYGPGVSDYWHQQINVARFHIDAPPIDTLGYGLCHSIAFDHEWSSGIG